MASGYDYNSSYDEQVKKASLKSNGIFIHDNQQLQFLIYGHIQRNIARPNTIFNISLPTSWNGINLKGALSPTNKIDSDSDGLTDWKEADTECGLIKWDNSGNIILPKFKDCISRASEKEAVHSAFLTYYKYLPRSINYILNASVLPIHSDPCSMDSDEDGFKDKEDPHKLKSDIKVLNLSNPNYININYSDNMKWEGNVFKNSISYGSNQGWFENEFYKNMLYDSDSIKGENIKASGCGLIAACDVFAYLSLDKKYNFSNTWNKLRFKTSYSSVIGQSPLYSYIRHGSYQNTLNYIDYMSYIGLMASRFNVSTKIITGVWTVNVPGSLPYEFNKIFKESKVKLYAYWNKNKEPSICKSTIEKMLKNNIPVIFCFDNTGLNGKKIDLHESTDLRSYISHANVGCHFMTVTGLIEYTPEAVKLTGHKTLLQVSSWGKKYYIDFEEYSKYLSVFSNILTIS